MMRKNGALALIMAFCLLCCACGRVQPPPAPESGSGTASSQAAVSAAPELPAPESTAALPGSPPAPEEQSPGPEEQSGPSSGAGSLPPEVPGEQPEEGGQPASQPPESGQPEEGEPAEQSAPPGEPERQPESSSQPEQPSRDGPEQSDPPEEEQPSDAPEGDPPGSRWLNINEATILTLINKERVRLGVPPLTMDPDLTEAARVRAAELYRGNYVAHTRPDGSPWETVLRREEPVEFTLAAENLAWTNHAVGQDVPPFQWFQMWQQSESHYAAMVNDHYTHCGVAVLAGPYFDGEEQSYAVTLFCSY